MNGAARSPSTHNKHSIKTHSIILLGARTSLSVLFVERLAMRFSEILFHPDVRYARRDGESARYGKKARARLSFACILLFTRHMKGYISSHTHWGCIRHEGWRLTNEKDEHGQLRKGPINKNIRSRRARLQCMHFPLRVISQPLPPLLLSLWLLFHYAASLPYAKAGSRSLDPCSI